MAETSSDQIIFASFLIRTWGERIDRCSVRRWNISIQAVDISTYEQSKRFDQSWTARCRNDLFTEDITIGTTLESGFAFCHLLSVHDFFRLSLFTFHLKDRGIAFCARQRPGSFPYHFVVDFMEVDGTDFIDNVFRLPSDETET